MKPTSLNQWRRGFTLLEVMVSTAIMVVIILAVVTMASSTFKAYDRAVADLTTQSEARGVLDAMENDFQTAVIRPDGRCWMEIILPGASGAPVNAPKNVGNLQPVDQPMIMLFASPPDRPRWSPVASNPRVALKGDVCAICYRFGQRSPFDTPGDPIQQVYGVYRTIIDAGDTFNEALPIIYSSTAAAPKSPWDYWANTGAHTVPNYNASDAGGAYQSRTLVDTNLVNSPLCWTLDLQNFIGSNVVSMQLVLWCSSSLPATATAPALADPLRRTPDTLRPVVPAGTSDNFKFGTAAYGGFYGVYTANTSSTGATLTAAQRYSPTSGAPVPVTAPATVQPYDVFGNRLRVYSDRMYPDALGPTSVAPSGQIPYLPYTLKAVEVSLTVLTPEGSKELRGLQKLTGSQSATGVALPTVNDYKRIVNQYGRNYTRYIRLLSLGG